MKRWLRLDKWHISKLQSQGKERYENLESERIGGLKVLLWNAGRLPVCLSSLTSEETLLQSHCACRGYMARLNGPVRVSSALRGMV